MSYAESQAGGDGHEENAMSVELYDMRVSAERRILDGYADMLNRRVEVENALLSAAKDGYGLNAERCRELAYKLGVPKL
jgi:hypothetical protein